MKKYVVELTRDERPWSSNLSFGRSWTKTGKRSGHWGISEKGLLMPKLLERYARGENLSTLATEYGFNSTQILHHHIKTSQLAGNPYIFHHTG
jgi:hypothetical protein